MKKTTLFGFQTEEIEINGVSYLDPKPFIGNLKIDVAFKKADEIRETISYKLMHNPQEKVQIPNQTNSTCLRKIYFSREFLLFLKHVPKTALFAYEFEKDMALLKTQNKNSNCAENAPQENFERNIAQENSFPDQTSNENSEMKSEVSKRFTKRKKRYCLCVDSTQRTKRNNLINVISSKLDEIALDAEDTQQILRESLSKTKVGKEIFPDFFHAEINETLGQNLIEEIKRILISYFFTGISQADIARVLGVCTKTVQRSFEIENPFEELKILGTKRRRVYIGTTEIEFIRLFSRK